MARHLSGETEGKPHKTSARIADVLSKIQTKYLPNTSVEHNHEAHPFGVQGIIYCSTSVEK
jgi:hypothetical protein